MANTRYKDLSWTIQSNENGTVSHEDAQLAVFMDLRDELKLINQKMQRLVSILECQNFLAIPSKLDRISKNTAKPRNVK